MATLNSILTLSKDFDYGERVRLNYETRPVETCFIPLFGAAIPLIQVVMPDAIILDLQLADVTKCSYFLKQLLEVQNSNPDYTPHIFVSKATSVMLYQLSAIWQNSSLTQGNVVQQESLITLETFQLEALIHILQSITAQRAGRMVPVENARSLAAAVA